MRRVIASARRALTSVRPTAIQLAGAAGVSWGLWDRWPWLGKAAGGALLVLFGLADERGKG